MVPTAEQLQNASIIVNTGTQLGANAKQLLASIEAALVESGLRNLNYGDRDSLGLFQQRPSQGWGSANQVMDPYYAAHAFFLGAGSNAGALQVSQSGTPGQLAQRVQRSAYPGRYDQREGDAITILSQLGLGAQVDGNYGGDNFFGIPVFYGDEDPNQNLVAGQFFSLGDYLSQVNPFDVPQETGNGATLLLAVVAFVGILVITR